MSSFKVRNAIRTQHGYLTESLLQYKYWPAVQTLLQLLLLLLLLLFTVLFNRPCAVVVRVHHYSLITVGNVILDAASHGRKLFVFFSLQKVLYTRTVTFDLGSDTESDDIFFGFPVTNNTLLVYTQRSYHNPRTVARQPTRTSNHERTKRFYRTL